MIQVVEQPSDAVTQRVWAYLAARFAPAPVPVEFDPRWLGVLRYALKHRPMMLLAQSGDNGSAALHGYLPLALVSSALFGRFLVSLPYLNRAGVVADDPATAAALIQHAVRLAEELDVRYLELRHETPVPDPALPAQRDEKVRMVLTLPPDGEALFKAVGPKVRNQVRKGDKSDLSLAWGGAELLGEFYDVFAVNMRDLGTPVYPRRLFAAILEGFRGGQAELAVVRQQGRCIAGAMLVHDNAPGQPPHTTQVPSASSLRQFNHTNANMWMYHQLLLRAMARGAREFDFGRSSVDSGTYKFKQQWGAQPRATVWQYHPRKGDMNSMRPDNAGNARKVELWKRLPVWLTRQIGPSIVRGIP